MNTKTIVTLLLVGAAIVLLPPIIEFLGALTTQNNVTKVMLERTEFTKINMKGFELDKSLRYLLFWLGAIVIGVAIRFMWYQRKHLASSPDLKKF